MKVGDRDGHGQYGILDDDGHSVLCHDCGRRSRNLALHVRVHNHTADTYRQAHGLSTRLPLMAADARAAIGRTSGVNPASRAALEASRDPDRARAANTAEGRNRPQRKEIRRATGAASRLGRFPTAAEIAQLAGAADLTEWAALARELTETGASLRLIAQAIDMPHSTVAARIARLAPRDVSGTQSPESSR